ncbi:putative RING-H2 finger protein ATL21A isoform X1 [Ipomoea triloba]|uniref:putative RING-H2 finger protein ATL21A isoform X1 n=1 Tax=Ipomoea triloba TaxID=35885 RepID=UPI00125D9734|nr:putative RING-H2 finger protein ATL21A isoform X1 [Ipomoea triloba]GLL40545.1 putative RING-H2 finger protein ATL21A isoform X1 [Ipomoea trifida]GME17232.1 putative RING-H2 finger protein ATL21A [Ipomoea batatas]
MAILKVLFVLPFFLSSLISARNDCTSSFCGISPFPIRFPFRIQGQQPDNCGFPGFNVRCSNQGKAVLSLPYMDDFIIRDINYANQEILLYDPSGCLASRLLSLNLSSSPFKPAYYQNYTFLSCSGDSMMPRLNAIGCLSNSSVSILATSLPTPAGEMNSCSILTTLQLSVPWTSQNEFGFYSDLGSHLLLAWSAPSCENCEAKGGICGFRNATSQEISCFNAPGTGFSAGGLHIFRIIALSIVIPAMTCSICISCIICLRNRSVVAGRAHRNGGTGTGTAAVTPQPATIHAGLDDSTIESYTKVVLGESRRVPGPNHTACPICLADYHPKETVRCIPECEHCFHAECIDEWLRINGSCPVCRNSPSPSPDVHVVVNY